MSKDFTRKCPSCEYDLGISIFEKGDGKCKICKGEGIIHDGIVKFLSLDTLDGNETCDTCFGTGQCQTCGGTGYEFYNDNESSNYGNVSNEEQSTSSFDNYGEYSPHINDTTPNSRNIKKNGGEFSFVYYVLLTITSVYSIGGFCYLIWKALWGYTEPQAQFPSWKMLYQFIALIVGLPFGIIGVFYEMMKLPRDFFTILSFSILGFTLCYLLKNQK